MHDLFPDPVQAGIWRTVRALNDAWTKGDPCALEKYFHQDMVAVTATDRHRLDGGETVQMGGRDLLFLVRENASWWAVADQFSAYPASTPESTL